MARIRSRAQGKAVRLGRETKQFFSWKHYVRLFPWGIVAGAAIVGYLMVPARRSAAVQPAPASTPPEYFSPPPPPPAPPPGPGLVSSLFRFAANAALRTAINYAGQAVGQYLANAQAAASTPTPPEDVRKHAYRNP